MAKKNEHSWDKYHTAQRVKLVIDELDLHRKSHGNKKLVLDGIHISATWVKKSAERLNAVYEALEQCEDCTLYIVHYGCGVRVQFEMLKPHKGENVGVSYSLIFPTLYDDYLRKSIGIKGRECVRGKSSILCLLTESYNPSISVVDIYQKNGSDKRFGVLFKDRCIWPWVLECGEVKYTSEGINHETPMYLQWPHSVELGYQCEVFGNGECVCNSNVEQNWTITMLDMRPLEIRDLMHLECCYRRGDKDFTLSDSDFDALRIALDVCEETIEEQDSSGDQTEGKILSLAKARTKTDIKKFLDKFANKYCTTTFVVSPKMDGCALRLFYDGLTGSLVGAITKGKGRNVVDIANLLADEKIIPKNLRLVNRGKESIGWNEDPKTKMAIADDDYDVIEVTGELCSADRKDIAGLLQRKSATLGDIPNGTKFFAYDSETLSTPNKSKHYDSASLGWRAHMIANYDDLIGMLITWGFDTVYRTKIRMDDIRHAVRDGINTGCLLYTDTKDYPVDGVVIRVNANDRFRAMGKTSHHPNGAIALKYEETWEPVIVKTVDTSIGVNNVHKVVIGFDTIKIGSRFVRSATAQFVGANSVESGDEVLVCLRGCVIPVWKFKD